MVFACGDGGRLSPQATKQLRQESSAFWVLWLSGYLVSDKLKAVWERGIFQTSLYFLYFYQPFCESNGGFGCHGLHLALKLVAYSTCFYGNRYWKRQIHSFK